MTILVPRSLPGSLLLLLALALAAPAGAADVVLRQVPVATTGVDGVVISGSSSAKTYIVEENGSGAALFDYDLDGDLDLYVVNGSDLEIVAGRRAPVTNRLYRNDGEWRFVDVTAGAGVGDGGWGSGCAVGDVDGDGDPDLYVLNWGGNVFYRNRGDGTFAEATVDAGLVDQSWGQSAAFGDLDGDGDLDLYLTNNLSIDLATAPRVCFYRGLEIACGPLGFPPQADRLLVNDGGGRFSDGSVAAGVHVPEPQFGLGVVMVDYDDDGVTDLYVANDSGPNFLFHGLGGGRFEEVGFLTGTAAQNEGRFQAGMGVEAGDADGDGRPDLFVTNFSFDHDTLYLQSGPGFFRDASYLSGIGAVSYRGMGWGTRLLDLDHDADLDLYVARGHIYPEVDAAGEESFRQPDTLLWNQGGARFVDGSAAIEIAAAGSSRGLAAGDLDGDGDLDLVVVELDAPPTLLRNGGGAQAGGWLQVAARPRRGPSDGEGTRLWLRTAERSQRREITRSGSFASQSDVRAHFGLGSATRIDRLDLHWGIGGRQRFHGLPVGRVVLISGTVGADRLRTKAAAGADRPGSGSAPR